jgi:hypothetical protein
MEASVSGSKFMIFCNGKQGEHETLTRASITPFDFGSCRFSVKDKGVLGAAQPPPKSLSPEEPPKAAMRGKICFIYLVV